MTPDARLYFFHGLFYGAFLLRLLKAPQAAEAAAADVEHATGAPKLFVALHALALGVMYFGIGRTVYARSPPAFLFPQQRAVGAVVIVLGTLLVAWTMLVFRSWRLEARIETGHELCTTGPFSLVRHPIYLALDLLAIGSFVWLPTRSILAGVVLGAVAADFRARGEEALLTRVFGDAYVSYAARVKRLLPGLY
jgi:protein-S-isoprenylcysteine O-methyltransferase Ste14